MTTIELGEVSSGFEPAAGVDRRLVRKLMLVAAVLLTLLTVAASVPAVPANGLRPLWSVPMSEADGLMLSADTAYLSRASAGASQLTAYDLAGGAVRWETALEGTTGEIQLAEPAGLVLLAADRKANSFNGTFNELQRGTIALDARTGRKLWTAPGQAATIAGGTALMADYNPAGTPERLRLIRLADRSTLWSRETPGLYTFAVTPDRVVTATEDGRIDVLRFADGARLTGARVRWVAPNPETSQFDDVTVTGDHLVVSRSWRDRGMVSVYRLDTMAEVWQASHVNGYSFPCGQMLCDYEDGTLTAYDLSTGAARWRSTGLTDPWAAGGDRVIADRGGADNLIMIDTATGRQLGEPAAGTTVWTVNPLDDVYLVRATASPPNRTSITRWEVATGRRHLIGTVDLLTGYRCQLRAGYLACNRQQNLEITAVG